MVQPKSPPISFRPSAELLAEIDAIAERRKLKRHATILRLLAEGIAADRGLTPELLASVAASMARAPDRVPRTGTGIATVARGLKPAVSVSAPLLERRAFNPQPKPGKKP